MPADSPTLTGRDRKELQQALMSALTSRAELAQLLSFELETSLDSISAESENLSEATFNVIEWAERHGHAGRLIDAAARTAPGNPKLRAFISRREAEAAASVRRAPAGPAGDAIEPPRHSPAQAPDAVTRLVVVATFCLGSLLVVCVVFMLVLYRVVDASHLWVSLVPIVLLAALAFRFAPGPARHALL